MFPSRSFWSLEQYNEDLQFWKLKVNDQDQGHGKGEKHIIGYNFSSNHRRDLKLSLLDSITQGPTYVTLTVTFDLDLKKYGQGQIFRKNQTFCNYVE